MRFVNTLRVSLCSSSYSSFNYRLTLDLTFQSSHDTVFICYNMTYPVGRQSRDGDSNCSSDSTGTEPPVRRDPQTKESRYSLDCLERSCELPRIQDNEVFLYMFKYKGKPLLHASSSNAKILAVVRLLLDQFVSWLRPNWCRSLARSRAGERTGGPTSILSFYIKTSRRTGAPWRVITIFCLDRR